MSKTFKIESVFSWFPHDDMEVPEKYFDVESITYSVIFDFFPGRRAIFGSPDSCSPPESAEPDLISIDCVEINMQTGETRDPTQIEKIYWEQMLHDFVVDTDKFYEWLVDVGFEELKDND
jgi:hypothetical protein